MFNCRNVYRQQEDVFIEKKDGRELNRCVFLERGVNSKYWSNSHIFCITVAILLRFKALNSFKLVSF